MKNLGVVNVCSGKSIFLKSLIKKAKINPKMIKFHFKLSNDYEPINFWGDNTKLKTILNND